MFSILMSAHNAEAYLEKAINSVMAQDWPDFELLVFNDGSTDMTGDILHKLQDSSLCRVFHAAEPIGVSAARNRLLAVATGEYILFLDADDLLADSILKVLAGHLKTGSYDMLVYDFERFSEKRRETVVTDVSFVGMYTAVWNKAFHKQLFVDNPFPEGVSLGEDTIVSVKARQRATLVRRVPVVGYFYRQRNGSLSHGNKAAAHVEAVRGLRLISTTDFSPEVRVLLNRQLTTHAIHFTLKASPAELLHYRSAFIDMYAELGFDMDRYQLGVLRTVKNHLFWLLLSVPKLTGVLRWYVKALCLSRKDI